MGVRVESRLKIFCVMKWDLITHWIWKSFSISISFFPLFFSNSNIQSLSLNSALLFCIELEAAKQKSFFFNPKRYKMLLVNNLLIFWLTHSCKAQSMWQQCVLYRRWYLHVAQFLRSINADFTTNKAQPLALLCHIGFPYRCRLYKILRIWINRWS